MWERLWAEAGSEADRTFLQALIQLSAALVKRRAGNERGAEKLFARSLDNLLRARAQLAPAHRGLSLDPLIEAVSDRRQPALDISS